MSYADNIEEAQQSPYADAYSQGYAQALAGFEDANPELRERRAEQAATDTPPDLGDEGDYLAANRRVYVAPRGAPAPAPNDQVWRGGTPQPTLQAAAYQQPSAYRPRPAPPPPPGASGFAPGSGIIEHGDQVRQGGFTRLPDGTIVPLGPAGMVQDAQGGLHSVLRQGGQFFDTRGQAVGPPETGGAFDTGTLKQVQDLEATQDLLRRDPTLSDQQKAYAVGQKQAEIRAIDPSGMYQRGSPLMQRSTVSRFIADRMWMDPSGAFGVVLRPDGTPVPFHTGQRREDPAKAQAAAVEAERKAEHDFNTFQQGWAKNQLDAYKAQSEAWKARAAAGDASPGPMPEPPDTSPQAFLAHRNQLRDLREREKLGLTAPVGDSQTDEGKAMAAAAEKAAQARDKGGFDALRFLWSLRGRDPSTITPQERMTALRAKALALRYMQAPKPPADSGGLSRGVAAPPSGPALMSEYTPAYYSSDR